MSTPRLPAATANLMLDAGIGSVANGGFVDVYDGVQPAAGGGAITTQVRLIRFTLSADAFPAAAAGILTGAGVPAAVADATGVASWARLLRSNGSTVIIDGDVGDNESPGPYDFVIDDVNVVAGSVTALMSLTIAQPLG